MIQWALDLRSLFLGFFLGYLAVGFLLLIIMIHTGDLTRTDFEEATDEESTTD